MILVLLIAPFVSLVFFPWPLTAALAVAAAWFEPLMPLSVGLLADMLYHAPSTGWPVASIAGACAAVVAFFVRSRMRTSIIH
jgi:hypothetical protein